MTSSFFLPPPFSPVSSPSGSVFSLVAMVIS
jgi:hypothetical protein